MKSILFILCFFISTGIWAKEYPMLHYTIEDGLPSNMIYDIYQDPDGIIWIGTDKGLAKYNGQKFETYTTVDGLADNECFFFQPDYEGRLWLGSFNGELCFYKQGKFHTAANTPWLKLPFKASVTLGITVNEDSSILVSYKDRSGFIEIKNEQISVFESNFRSNVLLPQNLIGTRKESKDKYTFFYTNHKIETQVIEGSKNHLRITDTILFKGFELYRRFITNRKEFFTTTQNKILDKELKLLALPYPNNVTNEAVYRILISNTSQIIATNKGLFINNDSVLLRDKIVHTAIKDSRGNYFIGTANDGIYILSKSFSAIKIISDAYKNPVDFAYQGKKFFYFTCLNRNLYRIKNGGKTTELFFKYRAKSTSVNDLKSASWIDGNQYFSFSGNNNIILPDIEAIKAPLNVHVNYGNLWGINAAFRTKDYLYLKDRRTLHLFHEDNLGDLKKLPAILQLNNVSHMYGGALDANQDLWFSSLLNIYKVKDSSAIIQPQFKNVSFREFVFLSNNLSGITHYNQLLTTDHYEAQTVHFDTIKSNDCVWNKFYPLNDSTLLISTNNYYRILTFFHGQPKFAYTLRVLENPFLPYQPEFLYVDKNNCYFFKNGSIISYPISLILGKETLPSLKFSTLVTGKNSRHIDREVFLEYFESQNINVLFTPITFSHKNLSYEYAITSNDEADNWIAISGEELNLVKIGFGRFVIKVRAKTMSGEYTKAASFILSVGKPYWATWWFISSSVLFAILVIAFASRINVKRTLKKKESEVRFLRSEYKALNALMNPHFIFNSLNSVQSLVNKNDNVTASKYIRIFSDLIRQNMRNISQDLISLKKEMNLVENYLKIEQLRFKEKLNYRIHIDEMVEAELIMIPPLLIQPLVENAVKHGIWPKKTKDGLVEISIYEEGDFLNISILDNGVGLGGADKSDTMHESYAMSNLQKRIHHLSQIHQIKISIEISEVVTQPGKISGVKSLVKIELPKG